MRSEDQSGNPSHRPFVNPLLKAIPISSIELSPPGQMVKDSSTRISKLVTSFSRWSESLSQPFQYAFPIVSVTKVTQGDSKKEPKSTSNGGLATNPLCFWQQRTGWGDLADSGFEIRVNGHLIAEMPSLSRANAFARQLRKVLQDSEFTPTSLRPAIANHHPAGKAGDHLLFTIDDDLATLLGDNTTLMAIQWINNLRLALSVPALTLAEAQTQMYGLTPTDETMTGTASWYGPAFHGQLTAAGETFDQNSLTAAHPSLPFGTYLKVTNLENGDSVIVRVNDRGPYVGARSLDLSRIAAYCLGSETVGVVPYEAVIMKPAAKTAVKLSQ